MNNNYLMGCNFSRSLNEDEDLHWRKEFDEESNELRQNFDINKFNDAFNKYRSRTQDKAHSIAPILFRGIVIR